MRARSRIVGAALAGGLALAGCRGVVAAAPPAEAPDTEMVGQVAGDRRVLPPKAARQLQDAGFTTRRFGTDSLWGWRAAEKIAARLRFAAGSTDDSTRVMVELWGPCLQGQRRPCLRREAARILGGLHAEEAAPQ